MSSELLRQYVEYGWALVPIPAGQKGPIETGWNLRERCITDPDVAEHYDGNVGLAHAYSGTCCVDIDEMEAAHAWFSQRGVDIDEFLQADNAVRIDSGREGRAKLLYALAKPLPSFKLPGFELRCASASGKTVQDVLPPSIHPDTKKTYVWLYPCDLVGHWSALPGLPQPIFDLWRGMVTPATKIRIPRAQGAKRRNMGQAREWLFRRDPDCGYDDWIKCGMGLHHEAQGGIDGLELWDEWSQRGLKYKSRADLEAHWSSFSNSGKEILATIDALRMDDPAQAEEFESLPEEVQLPEVKDTNALAEVVNKLPRDKTGKYLTLLPSLTAILSLSEAIGQNIAHDDFKDALVIAETDTNEWRSFRQTDYTALRIWFETSVGFNPVSHDMVRDAVKYIAEAHKMDTAQVWLSKLEWDGIPRIERFFPFYMNTIDTKYERSVGIYLWTALAGRVMSPGCIARMAPILIGPQSCGKSTGVAALVPDPQFFCEISLSESDDVIARKLRGVLVGEISEMRGLRTADLDYIKAFISRRHEKWVPKYEEFATTFARRCVMIGTSNDDELFTDEENTRWLPIRTPCVEVAMIERDREQLWAEALQTWLMRGVVWSDAESLGKGHQDDFRVIDSWEESVINWLSEETRPYVTLSEVLIQAVGMDARQITRSHEVRASRVMRKIGWEKKQQRVNGEVKRTWVKRKF